MISNLEYYRVFFAVSNYLHFSKAAKYLCVSQSAVSQSIRKLETELNCKLFERTGKGLHLTVEGAELYTHVKRAMQEFHTGENSISKLAALKAGEILIGATETSIRFYVTQKISAFKLRFPNIRITFSGSTTENLCKLLQSGELEIGFLISPLPPGYNFNLIHLADIQDVPVVSRDFVIDHSHIYSPSELTDFPLITVSGDNMVRKVINEWFLQDDIIFTANYTVRSMSQILPLVKSHLGIGILAEDYVREGLDSGSLMRVQTTSLPQKRSLYIATNPLIAISEAGRHLIETFIQP